MPQLSLYVDTTRNMLVGGLNNPAFVNPNALPIFYGDELLLNIYLLNNVGPQGSGNSPFSVIPTAGLALQVYLTDGTAAGTVYTNQVVFQADPSGTFFSGILPLNTPALQTLLGSNPYATAFLKIGYLQNALPTTVFSGQVTVNVGLPNAQLQVPPGQTPLSAEVAAQTFVPINGVAGQPIILVSAAGKKIALMAVDQPDGTADFQATPLN
jgi:hypothetical protein